MSKSVLTNLTVSFENNQILQICQGLNANEMHALYNKCHQVSSLIKVYLNTHNSVKCEVV